MFDLEEFDSFDFNKFPGKEKLSMEEEIRKAVMGLQGLKQRDKEI